MVAVPRPPSDAARAIRAVCLGLASEGQQRMAMHWIVNELCGVAKASHVRDSDRQSAFNEGKRAVGIVIFDLAGSDPALIEASDDGRRSTEGRDDGP